MHRLLSILLLLVLSTTHSGRLPPVPSTLDAAGLRVCLQGDVRLRVDGQGHVRFPQHGHRFPDNALRGTFDARGRLVRESGFRAPGMRTSLRASMRSVPGKVLC